MSQGRKGWPYVCMKEAQQDMERIQTNKTVAQLLGMWPEEPASSQEAGPKGKSGE